MASELIQVVVNSADAVFWMDENGVWHNEHGKFEHPKIIAHFNRSIRKDADGFYLYQKGDGFEEKVYFRYGETAFFAVDVSLKDPMRLLLNTGVRMDLDPSMLYTRNDCLYLETGEGLIKFTDRALVKLSSRMEDRDGRFCLESGGIVYPIDER